jgi:hypothetical protein
MYVVVHIIAWVWEEEKREEKERSCALRNKDKEKKTFMLQHAVPLSDAIQFLDLKALETLDLAYRISQRIIEFSVLIRWLNFDTCMTFDWSDGLLTAGT